MQLFPRHCCSLCGAVQPWWPLYFTARGGLRRFALQPHAPCPHCAAQLRLVPELPFAGMVLIQLGGSLGLFALLVVPFAAAGTGSAPGVLLWFCLGNVVLWLGLLAGYRHLWRPEVVG